MREYWCDPRVTAILMYVMQTVNDEYVNTDQTLADIEGRVQEGIAPVDRNRGTVRIKRSEKRELKGGGFNGTNNEGVVGKRG